MLLRVPPPSCSRHPSVTARPQVTTPLDKAAVRGGNGDGAGAATSRPPGELPRRGQRDGAARCWCPAHLGAVGHRVLTPPVPLPAPDSPTVRSAQQTVGDLATWVPPNPKPQLLLLL